MFEGLTKLIKITYNIVDMLYEIIAYDYLTKELLKFPIYTFAKGAEDLLLQKDFGI